MFDVRAHCLLHRPREPRRGLLFPRAACADEERPEHAEQDDTDQNQERHPLAAEGVVYIAGEW